MYRKYDDYDDDEYFDIETEEIVIEDDTWVSIRKRAAETGEDPNVIAERFKEELIELRNNRPKSIFAWYRVLDYYRQQKKLGIDTDNETETPEVVKEWRRLVELERAERNVLKKAV